jgi:hypothetical protein
MSFNGVTMRTFLDQSLVKPSDTLAVNCKRICKHSSISLAAQDHYSISALTVQRFHCRRGYESFLRTLLASNVYQWWHHFSYATVSKILVAGHLFEGCPWLYSYDNVILASRKDPIRNKHGLCTPLSDAFGSNELLCRLLTLAIYLSKQGDSVNSGSIFHEYYGLETTACRTGHYDQHDKSKLAALVLQTGLSISFFGSDYHALTTDT